MGAEIVFFNTSPALNNLNNFNDTVIVRLQVRAGKYVIIGRVVVINTDSDPQNASARMTTLDGLQELDRVDVRLGGRGGAPDMAVSLQATLTVDREVILDVRCASYVAFARQGSIIAIKVGDIVQFPPEP